MVVAPPDGYLGDDSSTPTPMLDNDSLDSGKSTPRFLESPSTDVMMGKSSPLIVAQSRLSEEQSHKSDENSSEDLSTNRHVDLDGRQPVSPLAKASYSSGKNYSATAATSSPRTKGLTILPSARHDSRPTSDSDEKDVISYKLSRESTTSSFDSEVSGSSSIGHEGTDM